jgi:hypothetical protein
VNKLGVAVPIILGALMATGSSWAQSEAAASLAYKPGDTIRVIVVFKEPVSLTGIVARFGLQGTPRDGQKEFKNFFDNGGFSPLSDKEYELDFKISEDVAAGTYQLQFINGTINPGLTRSFNSGTDFAALMVHFKNDKLIAFPDIRDVKLQPAK